MSDYEKIRKFESEILDKIYLQKTFYQYSDDIVIPYLLQMYGDLERHRDNLINKGHNETSINFFLTNMLHGISHCIRWIKKQNKPQFHNIGDETFNYIHEICMDFINWGITYHTIAQEFIIWSRGIKEAILDERNKRITFLNPTEYDYTKVYGLQLLYARQLQQTYESYPHYEMNEEFSQWIKEIDLTNPPIINSVNWAKGKESNSYPLLFTKMSEIIFPELPENTDFEGYNLFQLRQFYALFFLNFYFIRWVEDVIDSKNGVDHSFGSNPLYLSSFEFVQLAAKITGFSDNIVGSIIKDLTFDHSSFHTSISIQPFVISNLGTYYILPNLFSQLDPSRMITGSLNKSSKKKIYDKLINQIEKVSLEKMETILTKGNRWKCFKNRAIKFNGKQYQPDFVVIDKLTTTIIVIDYKHFVTPITASEVEYRMSEMKKGITQINKYLTIFSQIKIIGAEIIEGYSLVGILLTHKPMPIPLPVNTAIRITDLNSFTIAVLKCHDNHKGLTELTGLLVEDTLNIMKDEFTEFDAEIEVSGGWKLIRTAHKIN